MLKSSYTGYWNCCLECDFYLKVEGGCAPPGRVKRRGEIILDQILASLEQIINLSDTRLWIAILNHSAYSAG